MGMPFKGRYDRFRKLQKERMGGWPDDRAPCDDGKGDGLAMLIAALLTIVSVCLVMLAILALAGYFFIVR